MQSAEKHITYDIRAPPRRRIKGEDVEDQPVFLRKAFNMISSCPSHIGGWSEKGDTVIIKDVKLFSEQIIPTAYKHNNFSSFVRQLNFYGFRKIKSESLQHASWWEFRHPQFLKGQPNLLSEIKRSVHYESPNVHEVSDLKTQVLSLNDRIAMLNNQVTELTGLVNLMKVGEKKEQVNNNTNSEKTNQNVLANVDLDIHKKRKLGVSGDVIIKVEPGLKQAVEQKPFTKNLSIDSTLLENNQLPTGQELSMMHVFSRTNSMKLDQNLNVMDIEDIDDENIFEEFRDDFLSTSVVGTPLPPRSNEAQVQTLPQANLVVEESCRNGNIPIQDFLEFLSPELKVRFVDKLAEEMGKQLSTIVTNNVPTQAAVEVVSVNAASANSKSNEYHLPSGSKAPEIALPLASAAIGAFVSLKAAMIHQQINDPRSTGVQTEVMANA
eukprot:gene11985-16043_t